MDKTALVTNDLQRGAEIVNVLERAGLKINVALLAVFSEYGDWRLVLSARPFDQRNLKEAFGLIHDSLAAAGIGVRETPPILILSLSDPTIRDLRRVFGRTRSVEGMRLGGQTFGDRFIEDGYAYRIS